MPINEFDQRVRPEYVSNYIPLPFQELNAMAATQQKQYDTAVDETFKLNDFVNSVPTIHDPSLGLSNIGVKKAIDNKYAPRIQSLSDRIVNKGDLTATRELNNLKREIANDPLINEAKVSALNYKAYVEDKTKKAGKYDEILDPYRNQELYNEQTGLKPFRYSGLEDKLDIEKRFAESMDKIKEDTKGWDVESLGPDGIKIGEKGKRSGITSDKVMNLAKTKVSGILTQTPEGQQFVKKLRILNPNITNEQILQQGINAMFASGAQQIFSDTESGNSVDVTSMWNTLHKENKDKQNVISELIGQTIEGQTYNPISNDKEFQNLKDNGVLQVDKNGLIKVDWENLNKGTNEVTDYSTSYIGPGMGSTNTSGKINPSNDKQVQLARQMQKMAEVVGYKGKINSDSYEKIASAYNILTKARLFGEQLSAPVSNLESDKVTRNWDQTTSFDPNDINKLAEKPKLKEGDKIVITERQTNSNGEVIKKGNIINKDGTRTPIALKSNSLEDSNYFDKIGSIGISSAKYQVGEIKGTGIKTKDNKEVINQEEIPYIGSVTIVGDPKNRSDIEYRLVTDDGNRRLFSNYSDLQRYLEGQYYTETPEGQSDTQELINRKKQFETNYEQ